MGILSLPISLRNELTSLARLSPPIFFPLVRLRRRFTHADWSLLETGTELVIEGYFRCANMFAYRAFQNSQTRPVQIAHLTHAAATVIRAVRRDVPTLVLVREPTSAIVSRCIKHPHVSATHALRDYARFYRAVRPYADRCVIADFRQVISDFGEVVQRVNSRFQTDFGLFHHTDENSRKIRDMVDQEDKVVGFSNRPSAVSARQEKLRQDEHFRKELARPRHASCLARADTLYRDYLELAGGQEGDKSRV